MGMRGWLLAGLALLALASQAQPPTYYVRNIAVAGRTLGNEVYVRPGELSRYLTAGELGRVEVAAGELRLDGKSLGQVGEDGAIPLIGLVRALGYRVSANPELGIVDLTPPAVVQPAHLTAVSDGSRRPEYRVAAARMEQILRQFPVYDDPEMLARIQRVGTRVARTCPLGGLEWHFWLVDQPAPNAACVGEGHVFVTRGLMQLGLSDDELAGVLGHEIAHGVRRHCFHRVDLVRELRTFLQDYQGLVREIARARATGQASVSLQNRINKFEKDRQRLQYRLDNEVVYSRQDEEEADILGMRYAVLAGYTADGLGSCLVKLEQALISQFGTAILKEDMSHPPVTRRLEILRRARSHWKI